MTLLLALTGWDDAKWAARFRRGLPDHKVVTPEDDFDPAEVTYVCAWDAPEGTFTSLPNLEVIFSLGAGVDHIFKQAVPEDIPVVRSVNDNLTMRMTEWVCLHVLMHHRQQRTYDRQQSDRIWREHWQPAASAVRVGIMGLGVLGRDSAEKLSALGFQVAGWSRSAKSIEGIACFHGPDGLTEFLQLTDILVVLLPDTPDTRGILNRELFQQLPQDSALPDLLPVLINAGRGALQVETDILAALEDGTLKGATLDVFETEPLPAESPLWDHPLVTITPHMAADSEPEALAGAIARQILRYEVGEALENVVNPDRGY